MDGSKPNLDKVAFEQAYEMLRHYGRGLMSIRGMTLVQGYAILAGIGYSIFHQQYCAGSFVSFFGILLTLALYGMHRNYIEYYEDIRECIKNYEPFCSLEEKELYYKAVEEKRDFRVKRNLFVMVKHIYGPFVLLIVTMSILGAFCIYSFYNPHFAECFCPIVKIPKSP